MELEKLCQSVKIPLEKIETNKGQLKGLPANPRLIRDRNFRLLKQSIEENPEMTAYRELLVFPLTDSGKYIIIGGNMRYQAMKELGIKEAPCKVVDSNATIDQLKAYTIKDNNPYGEWDYDKIANEWNIEDLEKWGFEVPDKLTQEEIEEEEKQRQEEKLIHDLRKEWVVPPMSVFDSRNGEWQERKKIWRTLCDNKTIGESREQTLYKSPEMRYPQLYARSQAEREKLGISFREYIEKYATPEDLEKEAGTATGTSLFDPVLAEVIYKWFCPKKGKIIDPFGGEPTKGIVAGVLGFNYTAVEFRPEQVETNNKVCKKFDNVRYFHGDSNNIDEIVKESDFDLCFTSPPYYDLEVYSKEDMSALGSYEEFMEQYKNIFTKTVEKLKPNSFVAVKVGEIRDKKTGVYRNFVGDNVNIFKEIGLNYWNEIILVQPVGTAALRAQNTMETSRKTMHVHQNILVFKKEMKSMVEKAHENIVVFYKGDPKNAPKFGQLEEYPEIEKQTPNDNEA